MTCSRTSNDRSSRSAGIPADCWPAGSISSAASCCTGAPGTGKTHTVRYLLSQLPDVTVIVISGRALGRIREACSVARTLQPAVVVVEDVDLIAEQREAYPGEHPLLFQLLNEMDGLSFGGRRDVPAHHQPRRPARARAGLAPWAGRPRR